MKRSFTWLVFLIGLSGPAYGEQAICAPPQPEQVDPCIVGFWVGDNDSAETVNAQLRRMAPPGTSRTVMPAMPAAFGLIVTPGGAYVSMPFAQNHAWIDEDAESLTLARMEILGSVEAGYMTAVGGQMTFCQSNETTAWLELGVSDTLGGAREITIPITEAAGAQFRPQMHYSCFPSYLMIDVMLPPPINRVQYRLGNVGAESFGEYFSAASLERLRFGPQVTGPEPGDIVPVTPVEVIPGLPDGLTPVTPVEVPIPAR